MTLTKAPVVKAQMLIRRPARDVFEAFVDPAVTSQFWFTKGSDRLEAGKSVNWEWGMYGFSVDVDVKKIEPGRHIVIEWPGKDAPETVEWTFDARPDDTTFVTITSYGFTGTGDEIVAKALDVMGGFSLVLAAAKAWLEHGININIVADHAPDAVISD